MENVRIDKGVKRGPRKQSLPAKSPKADIGSWQIPEDLNPDEVIQRYLTESTTSQIAAQYGLSRKALTRWLRTVRKAEWKEAQLIRAHCRKEDGENGIDTACDALSLARAREQLKGAQFDLVALDDDYQPKQQVTHTVNTPDLRSVLGEIAALIHQSQPKVIEGEIIESSQSPDK